MIEITAEKQTELMEHAEKAYEHVGKMLECVEKMSEGKMGQREDDEWYIRRMNQDRYGMRGGYGMRDGDVESGGEGYGERRGRTRYRMGYKDPYYY